MFPFWVSGFFMINIKESLKEFPLISLAAGETLLLQGEATDSVFFMLEGTVKIIKDNCEIAIISDEGAVFGEMAIMLEREHSASVQCIKDSKFFQIERPRQYLEERPEVIWHIAQILCLRLFNLSNYLVDVKGQYEGHDHLKMVDDVLETLLAQQKTKALSRGDSQRDTPDY
jgi:CRP/FNR family cyclic AMP-dependent transcriptional regulator